MYCMGNQICLTGTKLIYTPYCTVYTRGTPPLPAPKAVKSIPQGWDPCGPRYQPQNKGAYCLPSALLLSSCYLPTAYLLPVYCLPTAFLLPAYCLPTAFLLPNSVNLLPTTSLPANMYVLPTLIYCLPTRLTVVFQLPSWCLPTAFQLFPTNFMSSSSCKSAAFQLLSYFLPNTFLLTI